MLDLFLTIGLLMLLAVMLPGPDFAMVTKNTVLHSRRAGIFTSFGIGCANTIHITYCMLGLAVVISQSLLLFSIIKYIGAAYLVYLGIMALFSKHPEADGSSMQPERTRAPISDLTAFRQGFLCNIFNPKATMFFLALFTVIIKPGIPWPWELTFAIEMLVIIMTWFCCLTLLLSHRRMVRMLNRAEKYIEKTLGVLLIGFGAALGLMSQHR